MAVNYITKPYYTEVLDVDPINYTMTFDVEYSSSAASGYMRPAEFAFIQQHKTIGSTTVKNIAGQTSIRNLNKFVVDQFYAQNPDRAIIEQEYEGQNNIKCPNTFWTNDSTTTPISLQRFGEEYARVAITDNSISWGSGSIVPYVSLSFANNQLQLQGTSSWATNALTASRAISASYAPIFPYVGTATITGSLIVSSSTTQLSGPSHIVRASTGDISLFATASSVNTQTQRFRIYDPLSTVGVSDHIYVEANTSDGGMYWSSNDEVIANYNQAIGRYNYGNNNLYVSSSDNRTYSPSGFVGPLIGTASWATNVLTASAATTVEVNDVPGNNATNYLGFYLSNTGYRPTRVASTKFVVNPATGSMGINKSTITTGYSLDVNGSVLITGSLMVRDILQLAVRTTTPTAVEGMIIASGSVGASRLFYYNGTTWNALF
jgi:hypothetical protein